MEKPESEYFNIIKYKCTDCDNLYSDKSSLYRHMRSKHKINTTKYICDCGKTYRRKEYLTSHKKKCLILNCYKESTSQLEPTVIEQDVQQARTSEAEDDPLVKVEFYVRKSKLQFITDFLESQQNLLEEREILPNNKTEDTINAPILPYEDKGAVSADLNNDLGVAVHTDVWDPKQILDLNDKDFSDIFTSEEMANSLFHNIEMEQFVDSLN